MGTIELIEAGKIGGVRGLRRQLRAARKDSDEKKLWFRGHGSETYKLVPTIGRPCSFMGQSSLLINKERNLLHRFCRRAYPEVDRILSEWEALFLARHYSLPTRIMDWTASPLVALYFACASNPDQHGTLWALERAREVPNGDLDVFDLCQSGKSPFAMYKDRDAVRLIHPFYNSPRIVNQDGVFTFHSKPTVPLEEYAREGTQFKNGDLDIRRLISWTIPKRKKVRIMRQLHRLGVSLRVIYPDLEGIAKSLWQTEVLFN